MILVGEGKPKAEFKLRVQDSFLLKELGAFKTLL